MNRPLTEPVVYEAHPDDFWVKVPLLGPDGVQIECYVGPEPLGFLSFGDE